MGWLSSNSWRTKESLVRHLTDSNRINNAMTLVKHSVLGNNLWMLLRHNVTGNHIIVLAMMSGNFGEYKSLPEWGYKDIEESCGPIEVNCPLNYLDFPAEPMGFSTTWRERVRNYHDKKSKIRKAKESQATVGSVLTYGKNQFKLLENLGRKGWRVEHLNGGLYNRLKATQVNEAIKNSIN